MSDDEIMVDKNVRYDDEPVNLQTHKKLLQAIGGLGNVQHIRPATRSEAAKPPDEFELVKQSEVFSNRVGVKDLLNVLNDTSDHIRTAKRLKNVQSSTKIVPVPLEKPNAERIKRIIGYEKVKQKLGRWDAIVARNRAAEIQVFPLKGETIHINTSTLGRPPQRCVQSELSIKMQAVDTELEMLKKERTGVDLDAEKQREMEENAMMRKLLTRKELIAQRKELHYLRLRESQKSAKARMRNKIKSKNYHKLLKRQRMLEQIKQFELLQKTDPEAALEKLNMFEKNRVLERASLRHRNTGSWAKNMKMRSKYDKDVQKDLAEQLEMSRQLTQKKCESDAEEEGDDNEMKFNNDENDVNAMEHNATDPFNPWTITAASRRKTIPNDEQKTDAVGYRKYWTQRNADAKRLQAIEDTTMMDAMTLAGQNCTTGQSSNADEEIKDDDMVNVDMAADEWKTQKSKSGRMQKEEKRQPMKMENGWMVEEVVVDGEHKKEYDDGNIDDIFDNGEDRIRETLIKKLKAVEDKKEQRRRDKGTHQTRGGHGQCQKDELKTLTDLSFKERAKRPKMDEPLNDGDGDGDGIAVGSDEERHLQNISEKIENVTTVERTDKDEAAVPSPQVNFIDPNEIIVVRPDRFRVTMAPLAGVDNATDSDEEKISEQQLAISEAFIDDDIIADFGADKKDKTKGPDTELLLSMPGWGSWAGAGISKEQTERRQRRLKFSEKEKRRDENKGNIYINEGVAKSLRKHLVSDLPFPFTSLEDYEASIRAPIGRTFVPEMAFRMLTRPSVVVRRGKIIDPMDESELIKSPEKPRNTVDKRIMRASKE